MSKPITGSYPEHFAGYINQVKEENILAAFAVQAHSLEHYFTDITEEKSCYNYAPGKWTLKELLQHIIDTERIFMFRALCIARNETQPIFGFDENEYAAAADANGRCWDDLCKEMIITRKSIQHLFESFTEEMLQKSGICNGQSITVLAIGFALVGHLTHHIKIIEERYLAA